MNCKLFLKTFIMLLMISPTSTFASKIDYPTSILVYGTTENDYISGSCEKLGEFKIKCHFVQAHISKDRSPEDLPKKMAQAVKELEGNTEKILDKKTCSETRLMLNALRTGKVPEGGDKALFEKNFIKAHPRQKNDMINSLKLLSNVCDDPSRNNIESMAKNLHDKELRTCKVWVNSYDETFTRSIRSPHWVSNEGPSGPCGVVNIDVLKKVSSGNFDFWVYDTKRIVTNKEAKEFGDLLHCKDKPEPKMFYDWKQTENFLACDYIKFGF